MKQQIFDAIVVGSGITGGWAAKELAEHGLKTLVLERGRDVKHLIDYPSANLSPWEIPYADQLTQEDRRRMPIQSRCPSVKQSNKHWWVDDSEHPYIEEKRFDWIRGYHVGGRSLMWARQCYRLSDIDFEANAREGIGVDWPIRYRDISPWYDYVERFIGVSGQKENLPQLPDGVFLPAMPLNCVEEELKAKIRQIYPKRVLINSRVANLTVEHEGRSRCQYRDLCIRGCPYGAYFSSLSSTLPAAAATKNLTLRPHSIVSHVIYDDKKERATGVIVIDEKTKQEHRFFAKVIFLNASTIGSAAILLNSISHRFPRGMGNDSGQLGRNLMDHHVSSWGMGIYPGFLDKFYKGRRPTSAYIPRFRNLPKDEPMDYLRGFGFTASARRLGWQHVLSQEDYGQTLKEKLRRPGPWVFEMIGFGESLPRYNNQVRLSKKRRDKWGLPLVSINCSFADNEEKMAKDMMSCTRDMLERLGLKDIQIEGGVSPPGIVIHEMGTARMGRDPKTSVLNGFNQLHAVPNVFVTDGACMTSSGCQNPSLTYMALTARAVKYAVEESKRLNI